MKVAITGANGYVGSSILGRLAESGQYQPIAIIRNTNLIRFPAGIEVRVGDVNNASFLGRALADVDVIIHNAGRKGADACVQDIAGTVQANISFTSQLLSAVSNRKTRIIFCSTYWVYGHMLPAPFKEEQLVSPSELYGWSKAIAEKMVAGSGLDHLILRLSNVFGYGSGQRFDEVASLFIGRAMQGSPLMLHNGGRQRVDMLAIDDFCDVLLALLRRDEWNTVFNVGSGRPVSIAELAEAVNEVTARLFNSKAELSSCGYEENEIQFADRWVDIEKIHKITGFQPSPLTAELEKFAYLLKENSI